MVSLKYMTTLTFIAQIAYSCKHFIYFSDLSPTQPVCLHIVVSLWHRVDLYQPCDGPCSERLGPTWRTTRCKKSPTISPFFVVYNLRRKKQRSRLLQFLVSKPLQFNLPLGRSLLYVGRQTYGTWSWKVTLTIFFMKVSSYKNTAVN